MRYDLVIAAALVISMTLYSSTALVKESASTDSPAKLQRQEKPANSTSGQAWKQGFVVWNGKLSYTVLRHAELPSSKAGNKLGEVTRTMNEDPAASYDDSESVIPRDGDSSLPVGTAIYQLAGAPVDKVLLIEIDGRYYKAIRS